MRDTIRLTILLVVASAGLAAASLFVYRSGVREAVLDDRARREIPRLPPRFARGRAPSFVFSIAELPQWKTDPVLVDTAGTYPESQQYCVSDRAGDEDGAEKGRVWHEHSLCGGVEALGDEFFSAPPFLHLSGSSYAALAARDDPARFGSVRWLAEHKGYLHITELREAARRGVPLTAQESLAADLGGVELRALIRGTTPVAAAGLLLVAQRPARQPAATVYAVHPIRRWERFLEATPFTARPRREAEPCAVMVGALCFEPSPDRLSRRVDRATALGAGSLALLGIALLVGGLRRLRDRRKEAEARLFVLQTLSHEIRTPTTSLALSLEPIRRRFDDLPEEVQPAFLRLCDGVQRLQRVVDQSANYLRGELADRGIALTETDVASANDFVRGVLDGYDRDLVLHPLAEPAPVRLDPYWVGVCLKNLVDNALEHGAAPVEVRLAREGRDLVVTVQDGGTGPLPSLDEMTTAFARGPSSRGLGFGLAIVQRLVGSMGGALRCESTPTRFSIVLPGVLS